MTKNASHVVVRHFFDNLKDLNLITMACCIVLSVVIVLILLIFIAFIVYVVVSQRGKQNKPTTIRSRDFSETLMNASRAVSNSYHREVTPRRSAGFTNSLMEDTLETNGQRIALSTFKTEVEGSGNDSSASSAGLCDVLFPPKHEGEIISQPPSKLVTFGGRVYATHHRPGSRAVSNPEPGASGFANPARKSENVNASLEWDYFESRRYGASKPSNPSEADQKKTVDICWV